MRFIREGLEGFEPEEGRYDAVWCQWVLGHLPDECAPLDITLSTPHTTPVP